MSRLEVFALVILGAGALGYLVSLVLLWRFRRWMGDRGQGWPRTLLTAMLVREFLLASLYAASLLLSLALVPRPARLTVSFVMGIALAVAPWGLVVALSRWWPREG